MKKSYIGAAALLLSAVFLTSSVFAEKVKKEAKEVAKEAKGKDAPRDAKEAAKDSKDKNEKNVEAAFVSDDSDDSKSFASVDVEIVIATDYVDRGEAVYDDYFIQKGKSYSSFKMAPAFQPSVTINSPLEGLSFNIWGSFAMMHRNDVDSDKRFQFGPGEDDLLTTPNPLGLTDPATGDPLPIPAVITAAGVDPNAPSLISDIYNHAPQQIFADGIAAWYGGYDYRGGLPGYYKDENGLQRADRMELNLDYTAETKLGNASFGILPAFMLNHNSKGTDEFALEYYVGYALPMFPDLSLIFFTDVQSNNNYYSLEYSHSIELTEDLSFDIDAAAGYGVTDTVQGVQEIAGSLGFTYKGFSIKGNVSHRPNLELIEPEDPATNLPLWLNGESTAYDGLVPDPARNQGLVNSLVNQAITDVLTQNGAIVSPYGPYAYVPRTKLPANIYFLSIGYSTSF